MDILRSFLFVPGNRPERFAKALASGADAVIVDLEDAVEPSAKAQARTDIKNFVADNPEAVFWIRINDVNTEYFADDVSFCVELPSLAGVILPKTESTADILALSPIARPIMPLIESAAGVLALADIAKMDVVQRLCFGALDLMLEMDITPDTAAADILLNDVRNRMLLISKANGLQKPIDTVFPHISDEDGLSAFATRSKHMGFAGMLCIHPKQVVVVHNAFRPSQAQLEWAQKIVENADATGSFAFSLDGQMIDQPVIKRARELLRLL